MVSIYNDDMLNAIKNIPDDSVDCVVTDPPYKIIAGGCTVKEGDKETSGILRKRYVSDGTNCSNKWLKKNIYDVPAAVKSGKMFSHNDIKFHEWIPDIFRVLKSRTHFYVMVNDRNVQDMLNVCITNKFKLVNILVWHKNNATPNQYYMKNAEFILLFRKGAARKINDMGSKSCITIPNIIGNKFHPSEKPIALMEYFIKNSCDEGDAVLDPFMGSGSTGVACVNLNRSFIGIEKDEHYYSVAKKRIEENPDNLFVTTHRSH